MKLDADPRVTPGPNFFAAAIEWMRRAALAVNPLVDAIGPIRGGARSISETLDGPAFAALLSTNQALTINAATLVLFDQEQFDTANCYSPANGRFTPNVAGYYRVSFQVLQQFSVGGTNAHASLYINGAVEQCRGAQWVTGGAGTMGFFNSTGSDLVFLNGTTDYLTVQAINAVTGGTATALGGAPYCKFSAHLARRA